MDAVKALKRQIQYQQELGAVEADRAYRSIEEARKELDEIEAQLRLAEAGEPYKRIGTIRGVDAAPVFGAFAALETEAMLQRHRTKLEMGLVEELLS